MSVLNVQPYPTKKGRERHKMKRGEPVWELAHFFPYQGEWTEEQYLALTTNHLIEFNDGYLEVLTMPAPYHQFIVAYLYNLLNSFVRTHRLGSVLFAPLRVRIGVNKYREPDLVFVSAQYPTRQQKRYWDGADLVMEVVSDSREDRERDYHTKRGEYAAAGISEYWIVDPQDKRITVLTLNGESYAVHGEFNAGQQATSVLLAGFEVAVTAVFEVDTN